MSRAIRRTRRAARRPGWAAALAVLVGLALAGCAAMPAPPARTMPDAVELAAVQRTADAFFAETADARLPWIQLWTSAQFPAAMQDCVADQSDGQLIVELGLPALSLSYRIVGSGSEPDEAEAGRIIARCAAATPLDDRVLRVPAIGWDALYSYDLTVLRPCLVARGFAVGAMPSRAVFEAGLRSQHPWSPYDAVTVRTRSAWYRIADACPALPAAIAKDVTSVSTSATTP